MKTKTFMVQDEFGKIIGLERVKQCFVKVSIEDLSESEI